jgi:hypothetical protein
VTRFGITLPTGASTPDVVRDITAVNTAIESLAARYEQGTLSARPAAAAANAGEYYFATDALAVFFSTGTAWNLIGSVPLYYSTPGPYTPPTSWGGIIGTVIHIGSAGLWRIVMSCDVTQSSLAGTPLNARLDVQIVSGATTFRAAGGGDELSVQTNGTLSFASSSKQTSVTVTGSGANLSVWAEGATGTSIKNIAVSVEPVSL